MTGVPVPTVTWEKDGRLLAGPSLLSGNESTLHIESTEVGAPLFSPYLDFIFVPQFFPLLAVQVADAGLYTCLATSPAGEDSRSFHVSIQGSVIPAVQRGGGCRMGPSFGGSESQSNPASSFGTGVGCKRGIWSTVMALHDLWGQGWGCSTLRDTLTLLAPVPQHPPAWPAPRRSPSSRLWQGGSSSWSAQRVLSPTPTSSGAGRAPCCRYL